MLFHPQKSPRAQTADSPRVKKGGIETCGTAKCVLPTGCDHVRDIRNNDLTEREHEIVTGVRKSDAVDGGTPVFTVLEPNG